MPCFGQGPRYIWELSVDSEAITTLVGHWYIKGSFGTFGGLFVCLGPLVYLGVIGMSVGCWCIQGA